MEHWKKKLGAICLMLFLLVPGTATAVVIPKDLPTIEALIALHKCIKKDEDQALGRVATSFGEQSMVTKGANKFNEVRTALNTKMSNAHSYLVLAGAISSTANSLYMLVKEYKDFTSNTFKHVKKKPFVGWYYADANVAIAREVKHCYKLYASVAASGINLMKASMDEKLNLVMTLKATIDKAVTSWTMRTSTAFSLPTAAGSRLHLGNTQLQREGRDSKSCHQSMEQRICQLKQSSQASSH